jgi:EpsD family peptidyl-prolyl cis-trans isomerase
MKVVDSVGASRIPASRTLALIAIVVASGAGCGDGKDRPASQVAARVNKAEVTVHQVNHALQSQRALRADQAEQASARILERLIDQELAVQKAQALKIDRDPKVLAQVEAARAEIVARSYIDKISEAVTKPTAEEIAEYYKQHPALFRERRIYQLQEVAVQAQAPQVEAIRRIVAAGKPLEDVLIYLRSNNIDYKTNQVVRAAEQVPLSTLPALAKLRDGQSMVVTSGSGVQVVAVTESRPQPIDEERARPAIEQFIVNDRKRRVVADDLKALRAAAKVEYVGAFAATATAAAGEATPNAADAATSAMRATSAPAPAAASTGATAAASAAVKPGQAATTAPSTGQPEALNNIHINKGLGLK